MVRRLKSELVGGDGRARFPKRRLDVIEVAYPEDKRQVHAWPKEYARLRQADAADDGERYATEFVLKLLKKRLFSSPAAFAATLSQHEKTVTGRREDKAATRRPSPGILRRQITQTDVFIQLGGNSHVRESHPYCCPGP